MGTKSALITGITGQDGSYLADLLVAKGYRVYGLRRRLSVPNTTNIAHLLDRIGFVDGDLQDVGSLIRALEVAQPDEVYNLAAQSFVGTSWQQPVLTGQVTALGATNLLEAVRTVCPRARFYQASTSEMYGNSGDCPQNEGTAFHPRSPYGVSKLYAHHMTLNYRDSFGLFACCGVLFNHESPRRGLEFVTRKVTHAVARIKLGLQTDLTLGNLESQRDWGYAPEYVEAMWMMLQADTPCDYVIATGKSYAIRTWVETVFGVAGLDASRFVRVDKSLLRPAEISMLCGDASRARRHLGWEARSSLEELAQIMYEADLDRVRRGQLVEKA